MLGLSPREAALLADRARARLGRRGYATRSAAFLVATAPLLRHAMPASTRRRSIAPLVYAVIAGPAENLLYARAASSEDGEGA